MKKLYIWKIEKCQNWNFNKIKYITEQVINMSNLIVILLNLALGLNIPHILNGMVSCQSNQSILQNMSSKL